MSLSFRLLYAATLATLLYLVVVDVPAKRAREAQAVREVDQMLDDALFGGPDEESSPSLPRFDSDTGP